jgi:lysophospholipase L1-like esterase
MVNHVGTALALLVLPILAAPTRGADPFELVDGDRVVWIGSTLIEREQRSGYWETALTCRYPDRTILFRNLGWSGDTVFGDARAGFDTPADGFRRLVDQTRSLRPTVILVGYGSNESFAGQGALPRFRQGLAQLLDALAPARARIVLLSPLPQENLGRPLPDPGRHNQDLRLYRDAIRTLAAQRGCRFIDFVELLDGRPGESLTDNGIHLTPFGYWRTTGLLERGLGLPPIPWRVDFELHTTSASQGVRVDRVRSYSSLLMKDTVLPTPPPPADCPAGSHPTPERSLRVRGLGPGKYALKIDGRLVSVAKAEEWASGVALNRGPEFEQVERLRAVIVEKNRLYFQRWRPQNETYLFGFRKAEQGQNAREVSQLDPLIADLEAEIGRLRAPQPHRYEIIPQEN